MELVNEVQGRNCSLPLSRPLPLRLPLPLLWPLPLTLRLPLPLDLGRLPFFRPMALAMFEPKLQPFKAWGKNKHRETDAEQFSVATRSRAYIYRGCFCNDRMWIHTCLIHVKCLINSSSFLYSFSFSGDALLLNRPWNFALHCSGALVCTHLCKSVGSSFRSWGVILSLARTC